MPGGHPKLSTNNSKYHRAGGKRANTGRKSNSCILINAGGNDKMQRRLTFAPVAASGSHNLPLQDNMNFHGNDKKADVTEMDPMPQDYMNNNNSTAVNFQDEDSEAAVTEMLHRLAMETDTTASNIHYDFDSDDSSEISDSSSSSNDDDVAIGMSQFSVRREKISWSAYMLHQMERHFLST